MSIASDVAFDLDLPRRSEPCPIPAIPAYAELGADGWPGRPLTFLEVSLTGSNLLHAQHLEFGALPDARRK